MTKESKESKGDQSSPIMMVKRINRRRRVLGISIRELARLSDVPFGTLKEWCGYSVLPRERKGLYRCLHALKRCQLGLCEYKNTRRVRREESYREMTKGEARYLKSRVCLQRGDIAKIAAAIGMHAATLATKLRGARPLYRDEYEAIRAAARAIHNER